MSQYEEDINHLNYYIDIEKKFIIKAKDKISKIKKKKNQPLREELKTEIKWREDNLNSYLKEEKELRKKNKKYLLKTN